jgi:hypothetical protein
MIAKLQFQCSFKLQAVVQIANSTLTHSKQTKASSSSYPYPTKWGRYIMVSSCCDKDSAFIFTTGRLPDVNPP